MSEASTYTVQQAGDPATPPHVLADIAAQRPDLRPAVARNPAAYPGLIEWLAGLGDPAIDVALWSRPGRSSYGAPAPAVAPSAPVAGPGGPPAGLGGQTDGPGVTDGPAAADLVSPRPQDGAAEHPTVPAPYGASPGRQAQPYGAPGPQGQPPFGAPGPQGQPPFGAPGAQFQPPYGAPGAQFHSPYGAPGPQGQSYGTPGAGADQPAYAPNQAYAAPGLAHGYAAPKKNTGKIVLIVALVVTFLVALVVVGIIVLRGVIEAAAPPLDVGSDEDLAALYEACAAEDWEACDELFYSSPVGSEYEEFGRTCGGRTEGYETCAAELGQGGEPTDDASTYGDDPTLDTLWDACEAGDGGSCDDLYFDAPIGSEYEEFGRTCGGRSDGFSSCTDDGGPGEGSTEGAVTYGDDPELDALWDACAAGDGAACDQLFWDSPIGSEYEEFGETCGGRSDGIASCEQG